MEIVTKDIQFKKIEQNKEKSKLFYVKFSIFKEIEEIINKEFVDIVLADPEYELQSTKREVKKFLSNKSDEQKHGAVAEFFAHIVLRKLGYIQQCLYKNLEENSMKKGFDGLYLYDNSFWIMESKSAITNKYHKDKITEAIDCIDDSIEEENINNPWLNAVHHILCLQNGRRNETILKQIKQLSKDYQEKVKHNLNEFNLIPVSTLFLKNNQNLEDIVDDINNLLSKRTYKNIIVVCLDNYVYDEFIEYLEN